MRTRRIAWDACVRSRLIQLILLPLSDQAADRQFFAAVTQFLDAGS